MAGFRVPIQSHPLQALEPEIVLVQSNGMAEWFKMRMAEQQGVCAAAQVELPARFLWQTYRAVLGSESIPLESPLDKAPLTWRLMRLLPTCLELPAFAPIARFLRDAQPQRLLVLSGEIDTRLAALQLHMRGGLNVNRALIDLPSDFAPQLDTDVVILPSKKHPKSALAQPRATPAAPAPPGAMRG